MAEDQGIVLAAVDDGGFEADARRPAVEDQVDVRAEVGVDVGRGGGADPSEPVRGRGGDAAAEPGEEPLGDGLVGDA